jgi:hypothetical protein
MHIINIDCIIKCLIYLNLSDFMRVTYVSKNMRSNERPMIGLYKVFSKDTMCKCKVEEENDENYFFIFCR